MQASFLRSIDDSLQGLGLSSDNVRHRYMHAIIEIPVESSDYRNSPCTATLDKVSTNRCVCGRR
jgi:hypothetical protein